MNKNLINVEIPQEVANQVVEKLQEVKALLLPYMAKLTTEERKSLAKMGDKTLAFVSKVMEYVETNPKFVPAMMNVEAFKKDFKMNQQMVPFQTLSDQISEVVSDTSILSGNEAYTQALYYYGNVKFFAKTGDAEAKVIYQELSQRFPRGKKSTSEM